MKLCCAVKRCNAQLTCAPTYGVEQSAIGADIVLIAVLSTAIIKSLVQHQFAYRRRACERVSEHGLG